MTSFPLFIGVPVAIEQMGEDLRFHLRLLGFLQLLRIAVLLLGTRSVAFGIYIGSDQNILPIRRPELTARFRSKRSQSVQGGHFSREAVELRDPDLRAALLSRQKREPLAIRGPARAVGILVGDDLLFLPSCCRNDPDVWCLRVGRQ